MTSPTQTTDPSLSDLILLTAAEKTWPGQVPQSGLADVAQRLRESLVSFPCLRGSNIVHTSLTKIDQIETNQNFLDVTKNILETVHKIRTILAEKGVLAVSQNPYAPLTPTVMALEKSGTLLPLEEINRQRDNERLIKTLFYANKVLEILTQAHAEILTQAHAIHPHIALIDAQPIRLAGEKSSTFAREGQYNQETKPEKFVWCGITFDKRMKLVPFLASCYLERLPGVSVEAFKKEYHNIVGKELNDANMSALLRNIRLKFVGAEKALPFQVVRNGGIQFVYDSSSENNTSEEVEGLSVGNESSEASFLDAPFDPQILTHAQPVALKKLSEELIASLHLDEKSQHILKALLTQKEPIHIDTLAQENHLSVAEINTYVSLILQTLWSAGCVVQITVENDYLQIIT